MKNKVIFRVDAANHIGTGHLQRCLTLAKVFQDNDWIVTFAMINFDSNMLLKVEEAGFLVVRLSIGELLIDQSNSSSWLSRTEEMDAVEFLSETIDEKYDLCIVDHYSLSMEWEKIVMKVIPTIMVIDDLADRKHACNLLLDQNYFFDFHNRYNNLVSRNTVKLLGPKYTLLRKEFSELRIAKISDSALADRMQILCNFGGIANLSLLHKLIVAASTFPLIDFIVVSGRISREDFQTLTDLANDFRNIQLLEYSNNMSQLMKDSDFCFGACGSTVWERFCLGLNSALISVAENQIELLQFLEEEGLIDNLGEVSTLTIEDFKNYLSQLNINCSGFISRKQRIMSLVDGKGAERVYSQIQECMNVKR